VTTAATTAVFNSTAVLEVGSLAVGTSQLAVGKIYYASVLNGLSGPVVVAFDPGRSPAAAASLIAYTGETWTINTSGSPAAALVRTTAITLTGYKRGLGQSYNLESNFERGERSVKLVRSRQQPLGGGAPEVLLHRSEVVHKFQTDILIETELPQWREFLGSVAAGELFTIDRYGTIASPVEPKQAVLDDDDYEEQRLGGQLYRIAFSARIL
jgi:hypothetical protein